MDEFKFDNSWTDKQLKELEPKLEKLLETCESEETKSRVQAILDDIKQNSGIYLIILLLVWFCIYFGYDNIPTEKIISKVQLFFE